MRKVLATVIFSLLSITILTGCASMRPGPEASLFGDDRVNPASANQMFDRGFESFDDRQLILLLDPDGIEKEKTYIHKNEFREHDSSQKLQEIQKALRLAFRNANNEYQNDKAHRAQIQDRLIAASNQRCNLYAAYLKRISSQINGIFGTLTTVLGGASAIVTGETAARTLGGLAGITSGTRAELNQAIFESMTTSVIIPAVQARRKDILTEMLKRRSDNLSKYTIEGAVADAIRYHGACSIDAGIVQAAKSIQSFEDVGIERFTRLQERLGVARSASAAFQLEPLTAVISASNVLDEVVEQLETYEKRLAKLSSQDTAHSALKQSLSALRASAEKSASPSSGSLRERANVLDEGLKTLMFEYAASTGLEKTAAFNKIKAQQIEASRFAEHVRVKGVDLRFELEKLEKTAQSD